MIKKSIYVLVLILTLTACVAGDKTREKVHFPYINLTATPFFPQSDYQCGPASLATLLVDSGIDTTPGVLVPKVYLPDKKGSLQIEMIAATRHFKRIPYLIEASLEDLIAQLNSGFPVLVLQNLGWKLKPQWHYAVVVGYEPQAQQLILRSGTTENERLSVKRFMRSWTLANSWGFVTLMPDELPANVNFNRYMKAITDMQQTSDSEQMLDLYQFASQRFPEQALSWFALANAYYQLADYQRAAQSFTRVLVLDPKHIAGRNNYAMMLSEQYCHRQALNHAQKAVQLAQTSGVFESQSHDTLTQVIANSKADDIGESSAVCGIDGLL